MTMPLRLPVDVPRPLPVDCDVVTLGLPMPDQDLRRPFVDASAPGIRTGGRTRALRALVLVAPLGLSAWLGWACLRWFGLQGAPGWIELALVAVSVISIYGVALSFGTAMLGLFWRPVGVSGPGPATAPPLSVAILLPMYGEPAAETIGNATALLAGLVGQRRHDFSLHVLSDSRDADAAAAEVAEIRALCRANPALDIQYRRRSRNTDYKSGNIRDWVRARGHDHAAMLILDADSIMTPDTVQRMADHLAARPGVGLVQTTPRILAGTTLWQRLQSFAAEVYGVNLARGCALWTGAEGNFLGHNALVRTRAFAACAGLPHLPGKAPRGGVILSHDFVEAALIRRAGWGIVMLPDASGSFEATPENLPGYLRRDRRWCQGNMQHLRLLAVQGLHPVSRFHLFQGAMGYLASVWWMVLLLLWAVAGQRDTMPDFFANGPFMPASPDRPALSREALITVVGLMLLGPKIAGIFAHLAAHLFADGRGWRRLPGFALSVLIEIALSILVAPALMLHQVRAVLRTLAGFDGGWMPHLMGPASLRVLARLHATETLLGLALIALAAFGQLTPWLIPVAVSLALTIPLSWLVQRETGSDWLLRPLSETR